MMEYCRLSNWFYIFIKIDSYEDFRLYIGNWSYTILIYLISQSSAVRVDQKWSDGEARFKCDLVCGGKTCK